MNFIDKDVLLQRINTQFWSEIENIINSAPSIDIVRCGECKWWIDNLTENDDDEAYDSCRWDWSRKIPTADDFCSYGCRSEKPNNCNEPQISPSDCATCKHNPWSMPRTCGKCARQEDGKPSMYEPKDEPQTQLTAKCLNCNNSKACKENHWEGCVYEPKYEKDCETCRYWKYIAKEWQCETTKCQGYKPKDEPQMLEGGEDVHEFCKNCDKSKARMFYGERVIVCGEASDMPSISMKACPLDKWVCKDVYIIVEPKDEPQTDCARR